MKLLSKLFNMDLNPEQTSSPTPPKKEEPEVEEVANDEMNFVDALKALLNGKKIYRAEWEEGFYGYLGKDKAMTLLKDDNKEYQWILSEEDLKAMDWLAVK